MASKVTSFRLDDSEVEILLSLAEPGETSHNQVAQRLIREALKTASAGSNAPPAAPSDWKAQLMPEIRAMIDEALSEKKLPTAA